jgi:hypothetical protein
MIRSKIRFEMTLPTVGFKVLRVFRSISACHMAVFRENFAPVAGDCGMLVCDSA